MEVAFPRRTHAATLVGVSGQVPTKPANVSDEFAAGASSSPTKGGTGGRASAAAPRRFQPFGLTVLGIEDGLVSEIVIFSADLFPTSGLPATVR